MRLRRLLVVLLLPVLALLAAAQLPLPGYTRLTLTDADSGRRIFAAILRNGQQATLSWTNSLFRLPVTEVYLAQDGVLVQDRVMFGDESEAIPVTAADVADLYHTGGAFAAAGLGRPVTQVIFRIGEIGEPRLTVGDRTVALKEAVGFGGRVRLAVRHARPYEVAIGR